MTKDPHFIKECTRGMYKIPRGKEHLENVRIAFGMASVLGAKLLSKS